MDISIIVPLYKGKKYIPNILDMIKENQKVLIKNQLAKTVEVIFINDYPTEKIEENDITNNYNFLIHIYKNTQNLGIHKSRLNGLSKAKGFYIVFLDQDDEITPFYLWRQIININLSDAVLCNGIYRSNRIIYKDLKQQKKAVTKNDYLENDINIISPGQVMIKRSSISEKWRGLSIEQNGCDDVLLWILMMCEGKKFSLNPHCDYIHNEDGKNTSLNFTKMSQSIEELVILLKSYNLISHNDYIRFEKLLIEKLEKYNKYSVIQKNWKNIIENIVQLYNENKFKRFAIYGYGFFGKNLIDDLKNFNLEPSFIIDKNASNYEKTQYKLYTPEYISEQVDLIILTPVFAEAEIRNALKCHNTLIISLNELIK